MLSGVTGEPLSIFPFIVGAGRSGTTLLRAMIDSHPDISVPREARFMARLSEDRQAFERRGGFSSERFIAELSSSKFGRWKLPIDDVREVIMNPPVKDCAEAIRRTYSLQAMRQGKKRYGDKTPSNVGRITFLAEMFPESRFVHIIRDGRDVALSQVDHPGFGPRTIEEAALDWRKCVRTGRAQGRRLGDGRYREILYERLIDDPERELRELCGFLELEFNPDMLRYFERAEEVAGEKPHFKNLYRPPTKGLRDWRTQMAEEQVAVFEALAGASLDEFGYERAFSRPPARARWRAGSSRVLMYTRRVGVRGQRMIRRAAKITRPAGHAA